MRYGLSGSEPDNLIIGFSRRESKAKKRRMSLPAELREKESRLGWARLITPLVFSVQRVATY